MDKVICPYCQKNTQLVTGAEVYSHRPDLSKKSFYVCWDCDARVGCHPGTIKPLGKPAGRELRQWRSKAHAAFDPLWKRKPKKRKEMYSWLASRLNIDSKRCHIGMMDIEQCKQVIEACQQ